MLNQPTFEKLVQMRMSTMALAFRQQTEDPTVANLSFEERFGMLVDAEFWSRHNNRLKRNIHNACLEQPQASLADINYTSGPFVGQGPHSNTWHRAVHPRVT